jgi:hypothetical protein
MKENAEDVSEEGVEELWSKKGKAVDVPEPCCKSVVCSEAADRISSVLFEAFRFKNENELEVICEISSSF